MTALGPRRDPFLVPRLSTEQLVLLRRYGQERPTAAGQVLFREGDRGYDFIVVLSGAVAVVDYEAGVVRELVTSPSRAAVTARVSPASAWEKYGHEEAPKGVTNGR